MEAVVRRADDIKKQARSIGRGLESHITITVDSLFPLASLAEVLKSFESNFPTVQIRLNVEAMGAVQEDVIEGRSTLGIIGSFLNLPAGLIGDGLFRVVRFPVAANEHPLAQGTPRKRIPHRMLLDHIQIVQSDRSKLTIGRDFTVYTGRTWRVSDLGAKRDLLRAGLGWGYMPDHSISDEIKAGVLRRIWVEDIRDRNTVAQVLVRRRDRLMGPGARWLIDRLTGSSP
jgi:DNA-binding transcriptional LysR family regulator